MGKRAKAEKPEGPGHNSGVDPGHLRAFIDRIETVETEIAEAQEGRKEIYAEARAMGFDAKIIRKVVALRKMDADKRREEQEIMQLYLSALGDLVGTPLGDSAMERAFQ